MVYAVAQMAGPLAAAVAAVIGFAALGAKHQRALGREQARGDACRQRLETLQQSAEVDGKYAGEQAQLFGGLKRFTEATERPLDSIASHASDAACSILQRVSDLDRSASELVAYLNAQTAGFGVMRCCHTPLAHCLGACVAKASRLLRRSKSCHTI